MTRRLGSIAIPIVIALCAAALYLPRRDVPSQLTPDEVFSALTAHAIATTGRDLNGRFMPLYLQLPDAFETRMWYQPILIYAIAASLNVLPFNESTVRLPATLFAVLDVVLAYCVGWLLFDRRSIGIAAAALLALAPSHFADSRVAMDHHAYVPFILGWLLFLLLYLRRSRVAFLFLAALTLGIGVFTYIAAYILMPVFAVLTAWVLYRRSEPGARYGVIALGFLLPVLAGAAFVAFHPSVISDTLWRYQRYQPRDASGVALARGLIADRLANAGAVYLSFWKPRVLFITGPRAVWVAGEFVLAVAGLLVAAVFRLIRRRDTYFLVLTAGLLFAAVPASFVGEPEVTRRAAAMMPFGVLVAAGGLEYLWSADSNRTQHIVFTSIWATVILGAVVFYQDIPRAQALVRAATVPLLAAGLAVLLADLDGNRLATPQLAFMGLAAIAATHVVYTVADGATAGGVALLAAISLAALFTRTPRVFSGDPALIAALVAIATAHFMSAYVDYSALPRIADVPARALILGARLIVSSIAFAAVVGVAHAVQAATTRSASDWRRAATAIALLVAVQIAYYGIDLFVDYRWRAVHAATVFAAAVGLAMLLSRERPLASTLGPIAGAGLLCIAALQFTPFYVDYFNDFHQRGGAQPVTPEAAFEDVIDRAQRGNVPAIYMGWDNPLSELYWRFYLIKHHREDLLMRTSGDLELDPARVRTLPAGSLVTVRRTVPIDAVVESLAASGALGSQTLLKDRDGVPTYWVLETTAR